MVNVVIGKNRKNKARLKGKRHFYNNTDSLLCEFGHSISKELFWFIKFYSVSFKINQELMK